MKFKLSFYALNFTLLVFFSSCGKVRFTIDRAAKVPQEIVTKIENVKVSCANAEKNGDLISEPQPIFFKTMPECRWEADGNYSRVNRLIRARQEQYVDINIPKNATLCDMSFNFPTQQISYDDEIFLTLGGKVLFSSQDYSVSSGNPKYDDGLMVNSLGLVDYKWDGVNGLANLYYDWGVTSPYCLGVKDEDMGSKCVIPKTETYGQFVLDIDKEHIIQIGQLSGLKFNSEEEEQKPLSIGFITIGDNDRFDCEHSDFGFSVDLKYMMNSAK